MNKFKKHIDEYGRISIPNEIRKAVDLQAGDQIVIEFEQGCLLIYKNQSVTELKRITELLTYFFEVYRIMSFVMSTDGKVIASFVNCSVQLKNVSKGLQEFVTEKNTFFRTSETEIIYVDENKILKLEAFVPIQYAAGSTKADYLVAVTDRLGFFSDTAASGLKFLSKVISLTSREEK